MTATQDLVPLVDRIRWMLVYRCAVVLLLAAAGLARVLPDHTAPLIGSAWLALSALTLPVTRLGRRVARAAFTASLIGDAVLLCALRPALGWLGWLGGGVELLTLGHVVAVTLLASFRTGGRIALWHTVLTLLLLESRAAGLLGPPLATPLVPFAVTVAGTWLIMVATASFAAINERELRRRRYDDDRLRRFGLAVGQSTGTAEAAGMLAGFARDELLAQRAIVVWYPQEPATALDGAGFAWADDGTTVEVDAGLPQNSVLRQAVAERTTKLVVWADDPVLDQLLPGGRNLIVVPFQLAQATGALVIEHGRWSSQRASRRVELRMIGTAELATAQASVAMGRAMLLEQVRAAAQTDGLTGLANRRTFDERLAAELADPAHHVTLVMVDLDHFKRLNDTHGHQVGDDVLRGAAAVLRSVTPNGALAARYGGEEMALIAPGIDVSVGERFRTALHAAALPVPVTASVGVAIAAGVPPETLLRAADGALYAAKHGGRDQVRTAESLFAA
ncbi:diguanylate cyclase domain-containing protein [Dactylosporangium sp. CA-152071]|uniref:GGDEF domain-containing protein n=1 Tax=Dactylosporangium sp. CA-152071 TaxID=3239933 RepID=UPI003D903A7F